MEWTLASLLENYADGEPLLYARITTNFHESISGEWNTIKQNPVFQVLAVTETGNRSYNGRPIFYDIYAWTKNWIFVYHPENEDEWEGFRKYPRNPGVDEGE